jgi:hypothetical protein
MSLLEPKLFIQPSIFMQRIGHLRILTALTSKSRRSRLERLGSLLAGTLTQAIPIEEIHHSNIRDWIKKRRQTDKYSSREPSIVHLQDAYLSDPALPSFTGSITPPTADEIVSWATHVGLIRRDTGSLSSLGDVLATLDGERLDKARTAYDAKRNPYLLQAADDLGALILWALVILSADLLVVARLLPRLPLGTLFDRSEAGDLLADVLALTAKGLAEERGSDARNRRQVESVRSLVRALEKQRGTARRGVREHLVAVRLEPLVDLGVLTKADPYRWQYSVGSEAYDALCRGRPLLEEWPNVGRLVSALSIPLQPLKSKEEMWEFLYGGFTRVQSPVRFAGLDETILAGICVAARSGRYFEWSTGEELILRAQRAAPREVRFNVDRYGRVRHIRLPDKLPPHT